MSGRGDIKRVMCIKAAKRLRNFIGLEDFFEEKIYSFVLILYLVLIVFSPDFTLGSLEAHVIEFRLSDIFLLFILGWTFYRWLRGQMEIFVPRFTYPAAIYVATYFLSALVAFIKGGAGQGLQGVFFAIKHFEYFLIFLVVANLVRRKATPAYLRRLFIFLAFLAGLWLVLNPFMQGINLSLTIDLRDLSLDYYHLGGGRYTIPFAKGAPPSAEFMEIAIPVGIFSLLSAGTAFSFSFYFLAIGVMVAGFLFTGSRAPIGSFFASILLVGPFLDRRIIVWGLVGLIVVGLVIAFVPQVRDRLGTYIEILKGGLRTDNALEKRVFKIWPRGIRQFIKNPIVGRGLAGFKNDDTQYIRTLANQGLIGIAAFFVFIYGLFRNLIRVRRKASEGGTYEILASALIISTVALLINGITATSFQPVRAMEPFWFLLGLVFAFEKFKVIEGD